MAVGIPVSGVDGFGYSGNNFFIHFFQLPLAFLNPSHIQADLSECGGAEGCDEHEYHDADYNVVYQNVPDILIQLGVADNHGDIPVIHDRIHKDRTVLAVDFRVEGLSALLIDPVKKLLHFRVIFVVFSLFRFV